MLENSLSCAVLHIAAATNSTVTISCNGVIVYELHNGLGWPEITDENSVRYLCNISQFGEYIVQASLEGITRTEKVIIDDVKEYFVSVKILFIYSSLKKNIYDLTINTGTTASVKLFNNYLDCNYVESGNDRQIDVHYTNSIYISGYSQLIADMEIRTDTTSNTYRGRLKVTNNSSWQTIGTTTANDSYVARTLLPIPTLRTNITTDVSNLSGTYMIGIVGFWSAKLYNLYLA